MGSLVSITFPYICTHFAHCQASKQGVGCHDCDCCFCVLQGTKCTVILVALSILVVLMLLAVSYSLFTCYRCAFGRI